MSVFTMPATGIPNSIPTEQPLTNKEISSIYDKCKKSIEYFAMFFLPHLVSKNIAPFQKEVYKDLMENDYYSCAAPRGHGKSTMGLIIKPMHYALFGSLNAPGAIGDISLLSASEDFIVNEIVRVIKKEFESNELLIRFFGKLQTAKWSETYFVLSNGVAFDAGGIGGQLRGGRRGLICLDDLESNESCESEDQRNKLRNRINKELIPKLLPGGQMIYFGTIISPLCYLKEILDTEGNGWKKRLYRAYPDGVQEEGHELWPEMMPHKELQVRSGKQGSNAFMSEYMNNPISDATSAIKSTYIKYWDKLPEQLSVVIVVDPAYSEDAKADYKVCAVVGIDTQLNRYLVHYLRTREPQGDFINGILNVFMQYKGICTAVGIPNSGTEKEFYRSVTNRATDRKIYPPFMELKNTFVDGAGKSNRGKKARAIAALQPLFQAGKYYIGLDHIAARDELLQLNPTTDQEHDDLVDVMAYAEQILTPSFYGMAGQNGHSSLKSMAGRSTNYGMED